MNHGVGRLGQMFIFIICQAELRIRKIATIKTDSRIEIRAEALEVHVQLHVTMHQRLTRIVGHEVHCHSIQRHDVYRIFYKPAKLLFADLHHLEAVSMQPYRNGLAGRAGIDPGVSEWSRDLYQPA